MEDVEVLNTWCLFFFQSNCMAAEQTWSHCWTDKDHEHGATGWSRGVQSWTPQTWKSESSARWILDGMGRKCHADSCRQKICSRGKAYLPSRARLDSCFWCIGQDIDHPVPLPMLNISLGFSFTINFPYVFLGWVFRGGRNRPGSYLGILCIGGSRISEDRFGSLALWWWFSRWWVPTGTF